MFKNLSLLFVGIGLLLIGCDDFIEEPLQLKKVEIYAPSDKTETNIYQHTFWWQTVGGASKYRLQIVVPDFNSIERLIIDTTVINDKFNVTLDPGKYQWRVRAENGSSVTPYSMGEFTIHLSTLTIQKVKFKTNNLVVSTNLSKLDLDWHPIFGSKLYRIQIDDDNFRDTTKLIANDIVDQAMTSIIFQKEGQYQIRVRAENDTQNSNWSDMMIIDFDVTPPEKVNLTFPRNKTDVFLPVQLKWDLVADAAKYELAIFESDSTTLINSNFPQVLNSTAFSLTTGMPGRNLVWKVRAIDKVGNKGSYSNYFSFTIQ